MEISKMIMGELNRGKPEMVFDWDKAAKILKERNIKNASAGLKGDWAYTGNDILVDGKIPEDTYTYLSSTWASPQLHIDTGESSEVIHNNNFNCSRFIHNHFPHPLLITLGEEINPPPM